MDKDYVLSVDAGGTKTIAVVAAADGDVLGVGFAGPANFQSCGVRQAKNQIAMAVNRAVKVAQPSISHACYGVSGADRDADFDTVRDFLEEINRARSYRLYNDTVLALRAGTADGVGVAIIAGTGHNTIGLNRRGAIKRVGGMGDLSYDVGSGGDIARRAVQAAFMAADGRGPPTSLTEKLCGHLELEKIEDVIEFYYFDNPKEYFELGNLAPYVFVAAAEGDPVAKGILRFCGREMGKAAAVAIAALFEPDEEAHLVLGGSVLQKGGDPTLIDALKEAVLERHRKTNVVRLALEPVIGGVYFALDALHGGPIGKDMMDEVARGFGKILEAEK